ncbi:MAG: hypothetical protein GX601_12630, partial [Anaerolineales bacterium]|nr:hypothetical protein [Anaerolineales bacterium]
MGVTVAGGETAEGRSRTTLEAVGKALLARLGDAGRMFLRPVEIVRSYRRSDLRPDVVAGLTVAVV